VPPYAQEELMKKLTLKLDELRVETFTTTGQSAERGTVQGHHGPLHEQRGTVYDVTCRNIGTCNPWAGPCADTP
jgi:hypothetical protein